MKDVNWIKFRRNIITKKVFEDAEVLKIWIWILCNVSFEACEVTLSGRGIEIGPGQIATTRSIISRETNINENKVYRTLKFLEGEQMIEQTSEQTCEQIQKKRYTLITLVKWADFRFLPSKNKKSEQISEQISEQTSEQQKRKKENEENEEKERSKEKEEKEVKEKNKKSRCCNINYINLCARARETADRLFKTYTSRKPLKRDTELVMQKVQAFAGGSLHYSQDKEEILEYAFLKAHEANNTSWSYINGILKNWHGCRTLDDVYCREEGA